MRLSIDDIKTLSKHLKCSLTLHTQLVKKRKASEGGCMGGPVTKKIKVEMGAAEVCPDDSPRVVPVIVEQDQSGSQLLGSVTEPDVQPRAHKIRKRGFQSSTLEKQSSDDLSRIVWQEVEVSGRQNGGKCCDDVSQILSRWRRAVSWVTHAT